MWTCEDTYVHRGKDEEGGNVSRTFASNFQQYAWSKELAELNLGDIDQIPIIVTGPVVVVPFVQAD